MLVEVKIYDHLVGVLLQENQGEVIFEFNPKFVNSGLDISPILMPLNANQGPISFMNLPEKTFKGLPPAFADSLPDSFGSSILNIWLQSQGKSMNDLSALEKLSYVGVRGMGALEYFPQIELKKPINNFNISDIVEIANSVLNDKQNQSGNLESLESILQIGSSAGGARAKAIIAMDNNKNIIPGDILSDNPNFKYYLMKIDGIKNNELSDPKEYGKIEYVYYQMAKECKIDMMDTFLHEENGRAHFITERFDRVGNEKIHMQTLCAINNMDYNNFTNNSYEQGFNVLGKMELNQMEFEKFYRRMVFNVLAKNNDDHTKNISFLMDKKGEWKLSPAYDLVYAYNPNNYWLKQHQMSINGKRNHITESDLIKVGKMYDIKNRKIIINEVKEGISHWKKFATDVDISKEFISKIDKNLSYTKVRKLKR